MERESSDGDASEVQTNIVINSKDGPLSKDAGVIKSDNSMAQPAVGKIMTNSLASRPTDSMQGYSDFQASK